MTTSPAIALRDQTQGGLASARAAVAAAGIESSSIDLIVLARHGLEVAPLGFDTMVAEFVIDPASRNLGLKNLAWVRLDHRMTEIEELIGKGAKQISMADVRGLGTRYRVKVGPFRTRDEAVSFCQRLTGALDLK